MVEFEKFLARHGEVVAQAVLENLERYEGVRGSLTTSLEERWYNLMQNCADQRLAA